MEPGDPRKKACSKRTKKFHCDEDEVIVSAWLNVSKDPVHGANQTQASFWRRIHEYFVQNKKTPECRSVSAIMHRWGTILREVNKFCGLLVQVENRNQSGKTIQDKVTEAVKMYQELEKKKFTLLPCRNKLKNEEKWKQKRIELAEQERLNKASNKKRKTQPKSSTREAEMGEPSAEAPELVEQEKRPIGQKKAKETIRRGGPDAAIEAMDKMWTRKEAFDKEKEKNKEERYLVTLEIEKKRLALEEKMVENESKQLDMDMRKEDIQIPSTYISGLHPDLQEYNTEERRRILARRLNKQN